MRACVVSIVVIIFESIVVLVKSKLDFIMLTVDKLLQVDGHPRHA